MRLCTPQGWGVGGFLRGSKRTFGSWARQVPRTRQSRLSVLWFSRRTYKSLCPGLRDDADHIREYEVETSERGERKTHKVNVSRKGLFKIEEGSSPADSSVDQWNKKSQLEKHLISTIQLRGPLSVSTYMREVLTNPAFGYYSTRQPFGSSGDFVTSPEMSQTFGELLGIWTEQTWERLGKPSPFHLVELGPGRGTMMFNIMRALSQLQVLDSMKPCIHFVEKSFQLQSTQAQALGCSSLDDLQKWHSNHRDIIEAQMHSISRDKVEAPDILQSFSPSVPTRYGSFESRVKVQWHLSEETVPKGPFCLLAHEFFDALPVCQFEYRAGEWRERLVDVCSPSDPQYKEGRDFRIVVAPRSTPTSDVLSARPLVEQQPGRNMGDQERPKETPEEGSQLELCPEGEELMRSIARRVQEQGGAALIMDYGQDGPSANSLRAIKGHALSDPLDKPGSCDLTADVDFLALRRVAEKEASNELEVYGPIEQGEFLENMGIDARLAALLKNPTFATIQGKQNATESTKEGEEALTGTRYAQIKDPRVRSAVAGYERIVDRGQMGRVYKVMAVADTIVGRPAGF